MREAMWIYVYKRYEDCRENVYMKTKPGHFRNLILDVSQKKTDYLNTLNKSDEGREEKTSWSVWDMRDVQTFLSMTWLSKYFAQYKLCKYSGVDGTTKEHMFILSKPFLSYSGEPVWSHKASSLFQLQLILIIPGHICTQISVFCALYLSSFLLDLF